MIPWLSASGLFRGVDDAWTCCLFALKFCCFFECARFVLLFGVCGLWQSYCMLVEQSCKSPVAKSVAVRVDFFHYCDLCLKIGIFILIVFVRGTGLKSYHAHESCHDEFVLKQPSHLHEERYKVRETSHLMHW